MRKIWFSTISCAVCSLLCSRIQKKDSQTLTGMLAASKSRIGMFGARKLYAKIKRLRTMPTPVETAKAFFLRLIAFKQTPPFTEATEKAPFCHPERQLNVFKLLKTQDSLLCSE